MRIRQATETDLAVLEHLYAERLALLAQSDVRLAAETVRWLERDSGAVWVGEADGIVGGYLSAWRVDGVWVIDHMALDAHTYYPGLARALVAEVRRQAAQDGATGLSIRVPVRHPVEQAFWRAMGAARETRPAPVGYEWMQVGL